MNWTKIVKLVDARVEAKSKLELANAELDNAVSKLSPTDLAQYKDELRINGLEYLIK